ncbi:hypothetical protein [Planobispora rosea]|uniref:hypothetical protein n=1 Tax=Planobispora rosea TaxID=35762 RepID=UPI00114CCD13|nr:hypothetical protein [Planobispora rosea]
MKTSRGLKDLKRAARSGKPVRVWRGIDRADRLDGYVVGVGEKWALLHTVSEEIRLDGYSAVRLADVEHATASGWPGARDHSQEEGASSGDRSQGRLEPFLLHQQGR